MRTDPTMALDSGRLTLRALIDRTSIEAFLNDGAVDACGVYFPNLADQRLSLAVEGGTAEIRRLFVHRLD